MNLQSVRWAFTAGRQHCTAPGQLAVLLVIASSVDQRHQGCVLSLEQLAEACVMSLDEAGLHLAALEDLGLICRGDEKLGENYPADRRPVVWNLAFADRSGPFVQGRTMQNMPGAVYRFFDISGQLLYVGKTIECDRRWAGHASSKDWWPQVARHAAAWYETQQEAHRIEKAAIESERPTHNKTSRW